MKIHYCPFGIGSETTACGRPLFTRDLRTATRVTGKTSCKLCLKKLKQARREAKK